MDHSRSSALAEPRATASTGDILVVGGYGVVGRRIAARLAGWFPGRVVIAGRGLEKAAAVSREMGRGSRARRIDVAEPRSIEAALEGVGTVIACVAQREPHLLEAAIARGLAYTDISPRLAFWDGSDALGAEARKTRARVLLGAGLSPGISNVMARRLADSLGQVEHIETAILLSIGDEYGGDSFHHLLESVGRTFHVFEGGRSREAHPFREGRRVSFPEPFGSRTAYVFPWSDVVAYPKTLGTKSSVGRFALDPAWLGLVAAAIVRTGAHQQRSETRDIVERLKRAYEGRDGFALVVTAQVGAREMSMSVSGRHQADLTAAGASELARSLVEGEVGEPGLWFAEQVIDPARFFEALSAAGWQTSISERAISLPHAG